MLKANIAGLGELRISDFDFRMGFDFELGWDIEPNKYWNICTYFICMYITIYICIYKYIYCIHLRDLNLGYNSDMKRDIEP